MNDYLQSLSRGLGEFFLVADKRTYWPFLLASLPLAVLAGWRSGFRLRGALAKLLSPAYWLHRSALVDYQLWVFNVAG